MIPASHLHDAYVVDASVAVKWALTDEAFAAQAISLLHYYRNDEIDLVAPAHILYEVPSAILTATRGSAARLDRERGRAEIAAFIRVGIRLFADNDLPREAYDFAVESGVSYYDSLYAALSRRLAIPLVVADRQFYLRARPHVDAVWLGSLPLA